MNTKHFKRSLKFSFTAILGIIIFNIVITAPINIPQTSDAIKGVWLTIALIVSK